MGKWPHPLVKVYYDDSGLSMELGNLFDPLFGD
jgi:hypothetical protein